MAVSTHINNKKNTSGAAASTKTVLPKWLPKKPLAKQVLASPCAGVWPTLGKKAAMQVTNAFVQCAVAKTDVNILKPPWKELHKVEPKLRPEAVAKYRSQALSRLTLEKREALLEALAREKEQLSHVFLGYNQIMKALQQGEVAALLINKTATPDLLPLSLIPACSAKGLPVVALENLDKLWRKCIAIAFKKSVKSQECSFHPLYQKLVQVTKKAADSASKDLDAEDEREEIKDSGDISDDESSIASSGLTKHDLLLLQEKRLPPSASLPNASSSRGSCGRRHRPPPPTIDVSKYHLTRTRTDQRTFIPGVGMNKMAATEDEELIMVTTDVTGLEAESVSAGFNYRVIKNKERGYQGKKAHRGRGGNEESVTATLGDHPSGEEGSSAASVTATLGDHPTGEAGSSAASFTATLGDHPSGEAGSSAHRDVPSVEVAHPKPFVPSLEKKSSHLMFQLDFVGDETYPPIDADFADTEASSATLHKPVDLKKTATVKRKRSKEEKSALYVPASVMRLVANAKRKKE